MPAASIIEPSGLGRGPLAGVRRPGFATPFTGTENPISENGAWTNSGLGQSNVRISGGHAFGTSSAAGGGTTGDSAAILAGTWPADMQVSVVLAKAGSGLVSFQEVEILLRASAGASALLAYEVFLEEGGMYLALARRNGTNGGVSGVDFTSMVENFAVSAPANGDVLTAQIVGNTITTFINGVLIWAHDITKDKDNNPLVAITSGSVGIGFDGPNGGGYDDSVWGFDSFAAVAL